jgi:hypothetical protein
MSPFSTSRPEEFRFDTGRSDGGDFIRVIRLPSGVERVALRRDSSHEQLLDEILEELNSSRLDAEPG